MTRRRLRRPLHPLRHPRARHGRRHERHGAAWRHHPVFRHVPGVLRLLPPGDPARRADGRARHPRDDARLDRPRRGRADASAGRASRGAARDPEPARVPALRRGRDASNAGSSRCEARDSAERAGADAPEPAAAAPRRSTTRNRCAAGAYEIVAGRRRGAGVAVRHRLGGVDRGRGAEAARRAGHRRRASCRCRASSCSSPRPKTAAAP